MAALRCHCKQWEGGSETPADATLKRLLRRIRVATRGPAAATVCLRKNLLSSGPKAAVTDYTVLAVGPRGRSSRSVLAVGPRGRSSRLFQNPREHQDPSKTPRPQRDTKTPARHQDPSQRPRLQQDAKTPARFKTSCVTRFVNEFGKISGFRNFMFYEVFVSRRWSWVIFVTGM